MVAKVCPLSGKKTVFGHRVSHANNKTRRHWKPNLQGKRIWVPSENRCVRVRISTHGLRTLQKIGLDRALAAMGRRSA